MFKSWCCAFIFVGDQFLNAIEEIKNDLTQVAIYVQGKQTTDLLNGYLSLDEALQRSLPVPVCPSYRVDIGINDTLCYIYTSGTTGDYNTIYIYSLIGIIAQPREGIYDFSYSFLSLSNL